jgi:hypothetical protein
MMPLKIRGLFRRLWLGRRIEMRGPIFSPLPIMQAEQILMQPEQIRSHQLAPRIG